MKKILVPTDFSVPAENAAHYAISLAKALKADVILCNAYNVPSESPLAAQVAWPLVEEADLEIEAESSLNNLVKKLDGENCSPDAFCPDVTFEYEKGEVGKVVAALVKRKKAELVVMGMAGAGQLVQWALGSNSKTMIDKADFPVLYVPYTAKFRPIKKIAFTTDLSTDDKEPIQFLIQMAKIMDAEITVYHITNFEAKRSEEEEGVGLDFFKQVISKLDYGKIKFENVWHSDIHEGLRWIRDNEDVDLIAMVHRQHGLLDKLVNGSYVHKLSRSVQVPLLVFQPCEKIY